jgi:hypothetical protein
MLANLAAADGFQFGSFDALANGVICMIHVNAASRQISLSLVRFQTGVRLPPARNWWMVEVI